MLVVGLSDDDPARSGKIKLFGITQSGFQRRGIIHSHKAAVIRNQELELIIVIL